MVKKLAKQIFEFPSVGLGMVIALGASLMITGCASTEGGPIATARKIHSLTPCGMMMESMMGNGHGGHSASAVNTEIGSDIDAPPEEHHINSEIQVPE